MRDLTLNEIEFVSGGNGFIDWLQGIFGGGEATPPPPPSNSPPGIDPGVWAAVVTCIQAGGSPTITSTGGGFNVVPITPQPGVSYFILPYGNSVTITCKVP